ncbi:MAG: FGGY-family carbohydrate kinase [Elainellaceae cyanobacterium]
MDGLSLGIDFGTSGARAIAIDSRRQVYSETRCDFEACQASELIPQWRGALFNLLDQMPRAVCLRLTAIAINGTSGTVLRCDRQGNSIGEPILYNDGRGKDVLDTIDEIAPAEHVVRSASSSLAKLLWWQRHDPLDGLGSVYFLHQADWLSFLLHGQLGVSDYHNSLKLGYDVEALTYPKWLVALPHTLVLPRVVPPGTPIAPVQAEIAERYGMPQSSLVCAGTTDSIAAFLASGAAQPGEAATSLGSTLVLKLLSPQRVEQSASGIYSHRWGDRWLVGGASNSGGAVLAKFFDAEAIAALSQQIHPETDSGLDYYPLLQPGERFPINDPELPPRLTPRPQTPALFLQGLLEGMARIEALGYEKLQALGAAPLKRVYSAGGGAKNSAWSTIRSRYLGVSVVEATHGEAAYGTARLAQQRALWGDGIVMGNGGS